MFSIRTILLRTILFI